MCLMWPENPTWDIRLYGDSGRLPDVLIISIDDDDPDRSLTRLINPVMNIFSQNNPYLSLWILHLCFHSFKDLVEIPSNFETFVNTKVDNLLNALACDETKQRWKSNFQNHKNVLMNVICKIWWIDLRDTTDANNISRDAVGAVRYLINNNSNCGVLSNHGLDIRQTTNEFPDLKGFVKPQNEEDRHIQRLYNELIAPFLCALFLKLETMLADDWHKMRFSGDRKRINTFNVEDYGNLSYAPQHHWAYGDGTEKNKSYGINRGFDDPETIWTMLGSITYDTNSKLDQFFNKYGYYKHCGLEFTSKDVFKPSIRALLQTDNSAKDLSAYFDNCKSEFQKYSYVKFVYPATIHNDYLWFNVVALYHALKHIIDTYNGENVSPQKKTVEITIEEIRDDESKRLSVKVLEKNIRFDKVTWPYSIDGTIHEPTENLLKYIRNQGVKKVEYKAKNIQGEIIGRKACFEDGQWVGRELNAKTGDNFTFKWFIPAYPHCDPYGNMEDHPWSCLEDE